MTMTTTRSREARSRLDHPVIDADGHMIELLAPLEDYVRSIGGGKFAARFTMNEVTAEAYEPVERGLLTDRDFRDFTFANPVKIFAGSNPDFFKGTRIEAEVEAETNT